MLMLILRVVRHTIHPDRDQMNTFDNWRRNIEENSRIIQQNHGPKIATVVSGSQPDQQFWQQQFTHTRGDVFRSDEATLVVSTHEETRKGNFLGGLDAWRKTQQVVRLQQANVPDIAFMCMVFGKGKRLSPFTQSFGNRKPAFLTPRRSPGSQQAYLTMANVANLSSAVIISHLQSNGFRGLVIKWGDEAIIPGVMWNTRPGGYANVDAARFVWRTEPDEHLAREKDWVVIDPNSGLMKHQYARQSMESLTQRMSEWGGAEVHMGVNLGSLAISYPFLDIACEVLGDELASTEKWLDWDPYVWMALSCRTEEQWLEEIRHEENIGRAGIADVLARWPDFYDRLRLVRTRLEEKLARPMAIAALDFGRPFWVDWGLHISMRKTLESLTTDSDEGVTARELFELPHERDKNGNIIVRSSIPQGASIRNSLIIDTIITEAGSVVRDGVVVGGRHKVLHMPDGGSALFCAADRLSFTGPHGVAFRSLGANIEVPEGGRHTTVFFSQGPQYMVSNETIIDYEGSNYSQPILENAISFEEASLLVAQEDVQSMEQRWYRQWSSWLGECVKRDA